MSNEQDVRYLLIDESWPDGYDDLALNIKADDILWENEKLKGGDSYQKSIRKKGDDINERGIIKYLSAVLYLFNLSPDIALNVLRESDYKFKTKEEVDKALKNRIFDKNVEAIQAEAKSKKTKKVTFESMCIPIEKHFKNVIIDKDITVAKYWAWIDEIKKDNS